MTPSVIQFAPIDDKLCVCNVFLEAFLLEEASLPATVEPVAFLSELTSELDLRLNVICKMKTTPDEFTYKDTTMLLQSMLKLLLTKKEVSKGRQEGVHGAGPLPVGLAGSPEQSDHGEQCAGGDRGGVASAQFWKAIVSEHVRVLGRGLHCELRPRAERTA